MSASYVSQIVHMVWSTSGRREWIDNEWSDRLYGYLGGIARNKESTLLCAGGMPDHVHLLISMPVTLCIAELVNVLKSNSSGWIHKNLPRRRLFRWQTGYGAFSVSKSAEKAVRRYIGQQAIHHRKRSFQDEFRELLVKHEIPFDEDKIWD